MLPRPVGTAPPGTRSYHECADITAAQVVSQLRPTESDG
ncbi:hypothetical protein BZL30_5130 [Mycobacterium kansasii]|uniref:Uncharacterized protein n=1 Tax=Mycobacterium kansasii TaxID=1768 RepID=A0A1V3X337_MYCKA|nr:hypothetical protein BZL30_5130 [Mycobacterium kansasii]OOK77369.1 hypothetical protein BZL29_3670 [Mycobacterium kansasii]